LYNLKGYYVIKFAQDFVSFGTWKNDEISQNNRTDNGSKVGGYIEFTSDAADIEFKVGSSFISFEQASNNLEKEIPQSTSFNAVKSKVKKNWSDQLNKITIKGATKDDLDIFYTAFYRTMQYPREFSEYGQYYSPFDDKIHTGTSYNAYSLWDTFRAQHPWLQITQPNRVSDMIASLIQMYKEGGWIPKWPNPSYTNIMIGTHADAVIADAYINGFRDYNVQEAYQAIHKNAFTIPNGDNQFRWGDRHFWNGSYEGRGGLEQFINLGYVASDKTNESVSRSLEFCLDDYCIAQMAKDLGHTDDYAKLKERALNYKNLFNSETGFFQAKLSDGNWNKSTEEGFTEGGKWTYRFCVMQDIPGLINMLGGNDKFVSELDNNFDNNHYRHDNEPGHHFAYMYNFCDRLDKTQLRIPDIIEKNYQNKPDGLSGNDDCGQMSAWYLFSSLGFYPVTPASGMYALGIPRFKEITVHYQNGKQLIIKAPDLQTKKVLSNVFLNGKKLATPFVPVKEILEGGILEFLDN
ncbi:MAG: GH92 family glycosyl hydrolase, partial [Tannerellaceae bacterium]